MVCVLLTFDFLLVNLIDERDVRALGATLLGAVFARLESRTHGTVLVLLTLPRARLQ